MSIENSYRNSIEILKVSDDTEKYHKSYTNLIVTFQSKVLSGLLEKQWIKELEDKYYGSSYSKHKIYVLSEDSNSLFFLSPVGAPITVGLLEEIVYSMGIQNIIMYGTCGVLDRNLTAGKIIVPTKAYRDEGTSYHYQPASDFIKVNNADVVSKIFTDASIDFVKGPVWTTDAFYRETKAIFNERKSQGCLAVEMEVSAVQAFADLRGVNLYSFIYGADNLDSAKWEKRILGKYTVEQRVKYFLVATEIISYLSISSDLEIVETREKDLDNIVKLWNDGEVMHFVGFPEGLGVTKAGLKKDWLPKINVNNKRKHYSIYHDQLGYCGESFYSVDDNYKAALDIKILPKARGKNIAFQGLKYAIINAFQKGEAELVFVDPNKDNKKALKLYKRLGFEELSHPNLDLNDKYFYLELRKENYLELNWRV